MLSHETHMQMADALRILKAKIIETKPMYCFLCNELPRCSEIHPTIAHLLDVWIEKSMKRQKYIVVTQWLLQEHAIDLPASERISYRLAWIDQMIDILES
jgi:hypothetical protein